MRRNRDMETVLILGLVVVAVLTVLVLWERLGGGDDPPG